MLNRKSKAVAYILWLFFGIHNFYAKDKKKGQIKLGGIALSIILTVVGLYSIWFIPLIAVFILWLLDAATLGRKIDIWNSAFDNLNKSLEGLNQAKEDVVKTPTEKTNTVETINDSTKSDGGENNTAINKLIENSAYSKMLNEQVHIGKDNIEKLKDMVQKNKEWFGKCDFYIGEYGLIIVLSQNGHLVVFGEPYNQVVEINEIADIQFHLVPSEDYFGIITYRLMTDSSDVFVDFPFDYYIIEEGITTEKKEKFDNVKSNFLKIKEIDINHENKRNNNANAFDNTSLVTKTQLNISAEILKSQPQSVIDYVKVQWEKLNQMETVIEKLGRSNDEDNILLVKEKKEYIQERRNELLETLDGKRKSAQPDNVSEVKTIEKLSIVDKIIKERKEKEDKRKKDAEKEAENKSKQNISTRTSGTKCCVTCEYWDGKREVGNVSRNLVQYPWSEQGRCHRPGTPTVGESRGATQNCGTSWQKWSMLR